jgi:short subunit fatty acids transporter
LFQKPPEDCAGAAAAGAGATAGAAVSVQTFGAGVDGLIDFTAASMTSLGGALADETASFATSSTFCARS